MSINDFFDEQGIIQENGVYKFKNKKKRDKRLSELKLWENAPGFVKELDALVTLLRKDNISIRKLEGTVITALLEDYMGCKSTSSKIHSNSIMCLLYGILDET